MYALRDFLGLCEVPVRGAPEEKTAGAFADGERDVQFSGHAEEALVHGGRACPLRKGDTGRGVPQRLDVCLEGEVEIRVYAGALAHAAGFFERYVFEGDEGVSLSHGLSLLGLCWR
jgi:hypothetical protein